MMTVMMMTMMMFIYHNDYYNPIISILELSLFFQLLRAVRSDCQLQEPTSRWGTSVYEFSKDTQTSKNETKQKKKKKEREFVIFIVHTYIYFFISFLFMTNKMRQSKERTRMISIFSSTVGLICLLLLTNRHIKLFMQC